MSDASSVTRMRVSYISSFLVLLQNLSGVVWPDQLGLPRARGLSPSISGGFLNFFLLAVMFKLREWRPFAGPSGSCETGHVLKAN
jgi:hypothetical protein